MVRDRKFLRLDRAMREDDQEGYLWPRELTEDDCDFARLALPEYTGAVGSQKRARGENALPDKWSLQGLAIYCQNEFASITTRLARLEAIVQQLPVVASWAEIQQPAVSADTREVSRGHLDRYCLPVLEVSPGPPAATINRMAQDLEGIYRHLDRRNIVSQIRKWFRKRREEMGSRILSALRRQYSDILSEDQLAREFQSKVESGQIDLMGVVADAKLEISDERAALTFARQKILSFLSRRCR